jgi:5-formyltetrahydrofolate cyclo-ligase
LREGILPKGRRYVHLSLDLDEAYKVGRRHSQKPKILVIKAREAYKEGIRFIRQGEIYLSEYIPKRFISSLRDKKAEIRERIWHLLEREGVATNCFGRIPNFKGKMKVAEILAKQDFFETSNCVFSAPDGSLSCVRELILREGKLLIVALPRMKGFVEIENPKDIREAATIRGFIKYGKPLSGKKIDLFIQGAVAIDRFGNRLGKGSGFGDKEWEYFKRMGLLCPHSRVLCIVHNLQIIDDMREIMEPHDKRADYIITPDGVIDVR